MKLLVLSNVNVEPSSSAAGMRMMGLLKLFHSWGYEIIYATTAGDSEYANDLKTVDADTHAIKVNDDGFDDFVSKLSPDVVLFDRFMTEEQFAWRVVKQCPNALRILDTEDLHTLRYARQYAVTNEVEYVDDMLKRDVACREIASIYRSDLTLMISSYEMALIQRVFKVDGALLHYLPFMVDKVTDENWLGFDDRKHFVSIGNFRHAPNADAVHQLKEFIWPIIHEALPEAELHIYGSYLTDRIKTLHAPETGFLVKGRAKSASEVLSNARLLLAPLRFGAGLKGKLLDAMRVGTPSVTTPIGVEGMQGELDWPGRVEGNNEEIARDAILLYKDSSLWEDAQSRAIPLVNKNFDAKSHATLFKKRIQDVMDNVEVFRRSNFIGNMLQHHSLRSTEYMSRWIMAKSKAG